MLNASVGWRGFFTQVTDWLSSSSAPESAAIRSKLIQSVLDRKIALVVASFCMAATAITAYVMTGQTWPLVWLAADIVVSGARLYLIQHSEWSPHRPREEYIPVMILLGLLWSTLFAAASFACMVSGHPVLAVMAAVNTAGVVGAVSSRNAPTPRFGALIIAICALPFAVGVALAPFPGMQVLSIIVPLWAIGMYVIMQQNYDIAVRMIRAEIVTRRLALTDVLTGLGNRMCLDEQLALACDRMVKSNDPAGFTLLYLDLDGFKTVNDIYGHIAGDALLKAVGKRLRQSLRPQDQICRNGGDEFAIILPNTPQEEATFVAKRIIAAIARPFDIGISDHVYIGVSIGSAHAPEDGSAPALLLAAADLALYNAKRAGKGVHREHQSVFGRARA